MHSSALILSINKPIDGKINNTCALCITLEINKQCWKIPTDRMRKSEREREEEVKLMRGRSIKRIQLKLKFAGSPQAKKGKSIYVCVSVCKK